MWGQAFAGAIFALLGFIPLAAAQTASVTVPIPDLTKEDVSPSEYGVQAGVRNDMHSCGRFFFHTVLGGVMTGVTLGSASSQNRILCANYYANLGSENSISVASGGLLHKIHRVGRRWVSGYQCPPGMVVTGIHLSDQRLNCTAFSGISSPVESAIHWYGTSSTRTFVEFYGGGITRYASIQACPLGQVMVGVSFSSAYLICARIFVCTREYRYWEFRHTACTHACSTVPPVSSYCPRGATCFGGATYVNGTCS